MQSKFTQILSVSVVATSFLLSGTAAFADGGWKSRDRDWDRSDRYDRHDQHDRHGRYDRDGRFCPTVKPSRHHYGKRHHSHGDSRVIVSLPDFSFKVILHGGKPYHYHKGCFYEKHGYGYVKVNPPVGAIVFDLPFGYERKTVNGEVYFYFGNTYYKKCRRGYEVVADPTCVTSAPGAKEYTVNIPNKNGSYTAVILKTSGGGFTGPQGEYYSEFPSVDQLRVMYGA